MNRAALVSRRSLGPAGRVFDRNSGRARPGPRNADALARHPHRAYRGERIRPYIISSTQANTPELAARREAQKWTVARPLWLCYRGLDRAHPASERGYMAQWEFYRRYYDRSVPSK